MSQLTFIDVAPHDLLFFEKALLSKGFRVIAGVDEVGRGCLAGPVVAAAVVLPLNVKFQGLKDSKQLTALQRDYFYRAIKDSDAYVAVGVVEPAEIDAINILEASLKAMKIAVEGLSLCPDYLLIDGQFCIDHAIQQRAIKKGDALSLSIAAASVMAKVTRDRMMCEFEQDYPNFQFSLHKGYGTHLHLKELAQHGPTPIHRMTFRKVGQAL